MHDLVIVVSDLYVSREAPERELPHGVALPGLQHAARFGSRAGVAGGWRSWLARWVSADQQSGRGSAAIAVSARDDPGQKLVHAAPATVAAAALARSEAAMVWMATPV
ncbi:MAG TPA: hypothetical protein VGO18_06940, partial [Steroidobacteraceae bacterium]|nr:hypothetical protein [Steroidobacteraceae bacterium]